MLTWKSPLLVLPTDQETVWIRAYYYFGDPAPAVFDSASNSFTTSDTSIVVPAYLVSRWATRVLPPSWDYEGILTVGNFSSIYGWVSAGGPPPFGSVNPSGITVSGFSPTTCIYVVVSGDNYFLYVTDTYGGSISCNLLQINGVDYDFEAAGYTYIVLGSNPFPSVGNTCSIKLK